MGYRERVEELVSNKEYNLAIRMLKNETGLLWTKTTYDLLKRSKINAELIGNHLALARLYYKLNQTNQAEINTLNVYLLMWGMHRNGKLTDELELPEFKKTVKILKKVLPRNSKVLEDVLELQSQLDE